MNAAQYNRNAALMKATGYRDSPALTMQSTEGDIPHGRELSFAWLAGTVLTGLTSILLMGAALYVSFQGQDTFSTAYEALQIQTSEQAAPSLVTKTDRIKPVALTRSEREIVEASIRDMVDGTAIIRKQPFIRVRATLATAATALSDDVPEFDPVALLNRNQPIAIEDGAHVISTDIYGAEVEGEVAVRTASLPLNTAPARLINDEGAAEFVRLTVEGAYSEAEITTAALGYAAGNQSLRELDSAPDGAISGVAENVTLMGKTTLPEDAGLGRTERVLTMQEDTSLEETLTRNGFTGAMIQAISRTLTNVYPSTVLPEGARLRILFGPSRNTDTLIPYRMSIYIQDEHAATVALTDRGQYVLGLAPPDIEFPDEDTEEINVNNLPSIYRSIWETGRKHDLDDTTIERIISMYAYDLDLNRRIAPGDSIEILQTPPDENGAQDLLYVGLTLGNTEREFFRFRTDDGVIDFFDANGETGKRFLTRRPLEGGGTLRSRFGYRRHPIFGTYKLHTGVDLAARSGTPIYAAGDGIIDRAQWVSGYGRFVEIIHRNGYETGYAHMSRIADGIAPGVTVRQGQIIGYVGSTGYSTGPHLHFEIKVNGRVVDPLSVRLPRSKTLEARYQSEFNRAVEQIRDLMERDPAASPLTVALAE